MGTLFYNSKERAQLRVVSVSPYQGGTQFPEEEPSSLKRTQFPELVINVKTAINVLVITTNGVEKLSIKLHKTTGPNNITNIILKNCPVQISHCLQAIVQYSINTGIKQVDVHLPYNYRPVLLTCVTYKLLEHSICRHSLIHLYTSKLKILTRLQHSFRCWYSCDTQLCTIAPRAPQHDVGNHVELLNMTLVTM